MALWLIRQLVKSAGVVLAFVVCIGWDTISPDQEFRGRRTQCASNLRNIIQGLLVYSNREGSFPTGAWPNANLPPGKRLSWYAATLPYLEGQDLWNQLEKDRAWDDESNAGVVTTVIGVLRCPDYARPPAVIPMPTQYIGIAGLGTDAPLLPKGHARAGVFGYDRRTSLADIADGAAHTMMVAESGRVRGPWLAGGPATVRGLDTTDLPYIGPGRQFGGIHPTGTNVAFADGSVRFVSDTVEPKVFESMSTISGGKKVPRDVW
jgi:prepilin-type processing-associated H-X9-DG protein